MGLCYARVAVLRSGLGLHQEDAYPLPISYATVRVHHVDAYALLAWDD